ncbi:50S ribosomal protein L20 [Acholeplasma hippikon]|uniref:Large ribosomal subunit protein bL20 n=1 Tax=Acholeplasma hippikon TaxID=264636 RepID=A0A449BJC2_9MOLU|nr:50S ribosomal protein L20 [Acholeplasma hippikon]VEU82530.1 50S ribosomal protein L20 [Acholeplasma hippikon]
MARVKGGVTTRARRKKVLKLAKGYFGSKHTLYRTAHEQVMRALQYSYRDRRQTKRNFRKLWISRINAAAQANGLKYSRFIYGLSLANVQLNRKVLADLAVSEPQVFSNYVELAKDAIANPAKYQVAVEAQKKTHKLEEKKEAKVVEAPVKPEVQKPAPKVKEATKPAPQVVKQEAPVTKEEVEKAEIGLASVLATALKQTAIHEGVPNARTAKKEELIKALAKLGYKPALGQLPIEDLLFTELKEMAKDLNIDSTGMLKADLVKAIKKANK